MRRGFTLLEVMVAIALLALGLVVLLQVQARSIQMEQQARNLSVATGLARAKLYDCQQDLLKKGFSIGDYDEEGDFDDEGFERFWWECHAYKPNLPVPDATEITTGLTEGAAAATGGDSMSGLAGAGEAAGMGAGMIAPVLGQISQVVGDSIRELTIIVKWQEGAYWEQLSVTTHVIDKAGINAVASQLQGMAGGGIPGMPPIPGMPGAGGGGGAGAGPGNRSSQGARPGGAPPVPAGRFPGGAPR
jgi:prepilin-type N-terminal cleavage/methylation domain-containing protein